MNPEVKEFLKQRIAESIYSTTPRTVNVYKRKEISFSEINELCDNADEAKKIFKNLKKYYNSIFKEMIFYDKEFVRNQKTIPNLINCKNVTVKTVYFPELGGGYFNKDENKIITRPMNRKKKTNSRSKREENDFYPTPPFATQALLEMESFEGDIWECAAGTGWMSEVLIENGYNVYSSDLIDRGYANQFDFLSPESNLIKVDNIITNPPYAYALEFVEQAKKSSNRKIAMLLPFSFFSSVERYEMFQDSEFRLKAIYSFSDRVSLYPNGIKMKNTGTTSYCWFLWEKGYTGETKAKLIPPIDIKKRVYNTNQ